MLEFIQNNETLSQVLIVVSLLLNALIGLKPVIGYIVKKTKTQKDDELFEKVFSLISKMDDTTRERLLDKINH